LYKRAEQNQAPVCWTQSAAKPLEGKELEAAIKDTEAVLACWTHIPNEALQSAKNLKYIGYWTNLAVHRVNMPLAESKGITVNYVPDYGTQAVASMALTGILAVLRGLPKEIKQTERGSWNFELLKTAQRVPLREEDITQDDLWFKKIGIVGFGPIGEQFARLIQPYGTEIMYNSRNRKEDKEKELGIKFEPLDELFGECDVVSVHLSPYAQNPRDPKSAYIDRDLISQLRRGSVFANTSSGNLVDQQVLFERLVTSDVRAYLDVYDGLPPRKRLQELAAKGNVFTYRSGWFTKGAVRIKGEKFLRNIEKHLSE